MKEALHRINNHPYYDCKNQSINYFLTSGCANIRNVKCWHGISFTCCKYEALEHTLLYDQTGDISWVKTHQSSCEKVLDWIIKRDFNSNGLVEMMTDSMQQKRGSDWIDIIWASYENAFVNAKLYHALTLWANIEMQLGNVEKEKHYTAFAQKLKTNFNKPTSDGGFWDEENKCYVHWRDKNGTIHGRS